KPILLTIFASGYSFLTAALLALGISESMSIRLLALPATMVGWWGWAYVAYPYFSKRLHSSVLWRWAAYLIALFTPLLFSESWAGTDVFLWASVPWVLLWLIKASHSDGTPGARFDIMAGALCGAAILMRYSSVFLAAYAGLLILWQSRLRVPVLIRRTACFALGVLPLLAVQFYINHFVSTGPASPGGLSFGFGFADAIQRGIA